MSNISSSPPRAPPIQYTAPLGTRWAKEKAAAGKGAFDLSTDPKYIGPWILGECVGKGASGRVKIAKHRRTGQLAAVKILPLAPLMNSRASLATQQAKTDKQRLGIDREITMMKLMNHPNIMRIYDVYEGEKELFLVLEYIEGGELFDFLVNRGRLPPLEALAYFKQIVHGLNYAHTFSIIHRDLKPENILIHSLSPPLVKIADWGMAAFAPPALQLETSCGSPHYASPEIVNGEKYEGNATDIWSCGVILYALLTGRLPFDDKNVRTLLAKVKLGKYDMPAWVDPNAQDLLRKMLVVDVAKRITIPDILAHPWVLTPLPAKLCPYASISPPSYPSKQYSVHRAPLPPSPSQLALPLASSGHIDPELLESLRVIWGRHADPSGDGEVIKRDLLSPSGQGTLAKAFYFLLEKYRESVRAGSEDALELDDVNGELVVTKQYVRTRDNQHLEVRSSRNAPAPPLPQIPVDHGQRPQSRPRSSNPSRSTSTAPPPSQGPTMSGLAPPIMARTNTGSSSSSSNSSGRSRPPSPIGPREPSSTAPHSRPTHADDVLDISVQMRVNVGGSPHRRSTSPRLNARPQLRSAHTATPAVAAVGLGRGTGGPRPLPPRRGYTHPYPHANMTLQDASTNTESQTQKHEHPRERSNTVGVSSVWFPQGTQKGQGSPQRPRSAAPVLAPIARAKPITSPIFGNDNGQPEEPVTFTPLPLPKPSAPLRIEIPGMLDTPQGSPSTSGHTLAIPVATQPSVPLFTAPRTANLELQKTIDDITDRMNVLIARENANSNVSTPNQSPYVNQAPMPLGGSVNRQSLPGQGSRQPGRGRGDSRADTGSKGKENQVDEGWSYVNRDLGVDGDSPDKAGGLGLGKVDMGTSNIVYGSEDAPVHKKGNKSKKGKKARPSTLELASLNAKRTSLSVATNATANGTHGQVNNRPAMSPTVGEFKGWFSNLFNWKAHNNGGHNGNISNAQRCVLYSATDIQRTRKDVAKLLENLGAVITSPGADFEGPLNCKIEEGSVDVVTGSTLKPVRFRVEFASGPGAAKLSSQGQPLLSPVSDSFATPNPNATPKTSTPLLGKSPNPSVRLDMFGPGCASAIVLLHEKGSVSTFRNVWRSLKEVYAESGAAAGFPCLSPAIATTPALFNTPLMEHPNRFAV